MRDVTIATTQMACSWDRQDNIRKATALVTEAAARGAGIVVLQELFETPYFCIDRDSAFFKEATTSGANPAIQAMQALAAKHGVVIPVSFFEAAGGRHFNSLAMIDADGTLLGVYRKSHIPDFPSYEEAFYFDEGDSGLMVFETRAGRIGGAVCWDQWFPEAARIMALRGAEILIYPTAIGRDSTMPGYDSKRHWQRTMQGHAAANMVIVAASNRVGTEKGESGSIAFYGGSFIADQFGERVAEAGEDEGEILIHAFDLDAVAETRRRWGLYRTRRTDLYGALTMDAPSELLDARAAAE